MSKRVDSKSRRPNEAKPIALANRSGVPSSPHTRRFTGSNGDGTDNAAGNTTTLESTLNHLHISHNYVSTYRKPQWYEPSVRRTIHKVHLVEHLIALDEQLLAMMQSGGFLSDWQQYCCTRAAIQKQFTDLLKFEMKFCRQHNVEQHVWKILYYNVIECMKPSATDKSKTNRTFYRQKCLAVIDDGVEFFERLLGIISATYKFDMADFIGVNGGTPLKGLKYVSLAIVSAQKLCIYLGDLLRYREVFNEGKNFETVKQWYVWAQQLIPTNGMPYNQLAVLSLYNKRKFDAVYYHQRSLNASNPIKSAKESLVVLFDEIRKKYEAQQKTTPKELTTRQRRRSENFRREIWIHPLDGQLNYRTVCLEENDDDTEVLDSTDLYKRFIANYLHYQGMLFTKVGAESLESCITQLLKEFTELLGHQTSDIITLQKLVNLTVLNTFAIEYNREGNQNAQPSELQVNAVALAMCFFGILVERLLKEFTELQSTIVMVAKSCGDVTLVADTTIAPKPQSDLDQFNIIDINEFVVPEFINSLLAAVLLWCNWMHSNESVWHTVQVATATNRMAEKYGNYPWDEFAGLITVFGKYRFDEGLVMTQQPSDPPVQLKIEKIRLPEDLLVLGLPHLLQDETFYCREQYSKTIVYTIVRMKYIWKFGSEFLCSCQPPLLQRTDSPHPNAPISYAACPGIRNIPGDNDATAAGEMTRTAVVNSWDESMDGYASSNSESNQALSEDDARHNVKLTEKLLENPDAVSNIADQASANEIQRLVQRKIELERNQKFHENQHRYTQEVLTRQSKCETLLIEVRPKHLVADTNCFIDFLPQLKSVAHAHPMYHVIVPLVVLKELEGLAKGDRPLDEPTSVGPSTQVQTRKSMAAHSALHFLQTAGKLIRCATTKGSILKSMAFTLESDEPKHGASTTEHLNNDDKILLTAVNLSQFYCGRSNAMDSCHSSTANKVATANISTAPSNTSTAEMKSTMQRQVVLLTNDRNLKVKAIAQNIPVREVLDFLKWSGITH